MKQVSHILSACLLLTLIYSGFFLVRFTATQESYVEANSQPPAGNSVVNNETYSAGKKIFQQHCQTCHALDKELTGPALRGFMSRGPWADRKEIYKWINNPAAYSSQNKYAAALQQQYGVIMPAFNLSAKEIDQIIDYINGVAVSVPMPLAVNY